MTQFVSLFRKFVGRQLSLNFNTYRETSNYIDYFILLFSFSRPSYLYLVLLFISLEITESCIPTHPKLTIKTSCIDPHLLQNTFVSKHAYQLVSSRQQSLDINIFRLYTLFGIKRLLIPLPIGFTFCEHRKVSSCLWQLLALFWTDLIALGLLTTHSTFIASVVIF